MPRFKTAALRQRLLPMSIVAVPSRVQLRMEFRMVKDKTPLKDYIVVFGVFSSCLIALGYIYIAGATRLYSDAVRQLTDASFTFSKLQDLGLTLIFSFVMGVVPLILLSGLLQGKKKTAGFESARKFLILSVISLSISFAFGIFLFNFLGLSLERFLVLTFATPVIILVFGYVFERTLWSGISHFLALIGVDDCDLCPNKSLKALLSSLVVIGAFLGPVAYAAGECRTYHLLINAKSKYRLPNGDVVITSILGASADCHITALYFGDKWELDMEVFFTVYCGVGRGAPFDVLSKRTRIPFRHDTLEP